MEWYLVLALLFGAILALMVAGFPVGVAFLAVNVVAAMPSISAASGRGF